MLRRPYVLGYYSPNYVIAHHVRVCCVWGHHFQTNWCDLTFIVSSQAIFGEERNARRLDDEGHRCSHRGSLHHLSVECLRGTTGGTLAKGPLDTDQIVPLWYHHHHHQQLQKQRQAVLRGRGVGHGGPASRQASEGLFFARPLVVRAPLDVARKDERSVSRWFEGGKNCGISPGMFDCLMGRKTVDNVPLVFFDGDGSRRGYWKWPPTF